MKKTTILAIVFSLSAAFAVPSLSAVNAETTVTVDEQNDIDKTLDQYDRFVKRLSKLVDRAMTGDMEAVENLQTLVPEGEKLAGKLEKMKDNMNEEQTKRLVEISKSLMEVYNKVSN